MSHTVCRASHWAYGVAGYHIRLALVLSCGGSPVRVRICPLFGSKPCSGQVDLSSNLLIYQVGRHAVFQLLKRTEHEQVVR